MRMEQSASDLASRVANLPPEKRELLARMRMLKQERADAIPRRDGSGPWPLSSSQSRLWFLEQLAPGLPTYNAALAMRVRGPLDRERLRRAIEVVIDRHEALRTVFPADDGLPRQLPLERWSFELPELDLRSLPPAERETEMLRLLREEARRPFDLGSDLMLRALICRIADDDRALMFVEHHIAFDGWSDAALFAELEELYQALACDREPQLPDLPIQYRDFAVWQNESLHGELLESHREFWRRELDGAPPHIELPTDLARPPIQQFAGSHHHFTLPGELGESVRELSRRERVTPYMTLLAAFKVLLHRWCGDEDLLVGTPIANRGRVELEPLIGFFSNTLALRTRLDGAPTFREAIARVKRSTLAAFDHQDFPFEKVVEAVRPPRDPSRNPIFQVNFRVQSAAPPQLSLPGLEIEPFDLDLGFARFDLALELQLRPDRFCGYLEYNLALFEPATAAWLVDAFELLLSDAVMRPDVPVTQLAWPGRAG
jgi:condensation domain-containing protein